VFRFPKHGFPTTLVLLLSPLPSTTRTDIYLMNCSPLLSFTPRHPLSRRPSLTPIRLDSISEHPEFERNPSDSDGYNVSLNLGAESPKSILHDDMTSSPVSDDPQSSVTRSSRPEDDWTRSGLAVHTNVPMRARNWRSSSFGEKQRKHPRLARETVDRDCGIWSARLLLASFGPHCSRFTIF
jgi:hypothetical protein